VLFNEPKLLKFTSHPYRARAGPRFSALQRAEIAEIPEPSIDGVGEGVGFSALQRAEIAEMQIFEPDATIRSRFSALQRAEIAEIKRHRDTLLRLGHVSVLFNEPKLLKSIWAAGARCLRCSFSALQRAEIAEILHALGGR